MLQTRVKSLELENDRLISNVADVRAKINESDFRRDLDRELANVKKHFTGELKKITDHYEAQIDDLKNTVSKLKKSPASAATATSESSHRIRLDIPKFQGLENERPMKFLSEFKKYLDVVKPNDSQLMCLISQALENEASNWWYTHEGEVDSYEDIVERFQARYWDSNTQRTAKRKIEYSQFYSGGATNRVNYATNMYGIAKEVDMNYTEEKFVFKLSEHFKRTIPI